MSQASRVLLAEADSISTQLLSFSLEREGFEVIKAHGGLDALRIAREQSVDIVLSEVLLPDIDGLELCKRLRADWNTQRIPLVLITSLGSSEERIAGLTSGADEYLVKPYDVRELMVRLNHLLDTYSNCCQLHPLTRLPGAPLIESYVEKTCDGDRPWALMQIDITNFGAYNQIYGFDAGNQVLLRTADMLRDVVLKGDQEPLFLGHEGRDDFTAVISLERSSSVSEMLIKRFDEEAPGFYPPEHRESRYQVLIDRRGNSHLVPALGLAIGVVTGDLCDSLTYLELREAANTVLQRARAEEHSNMFVNRRRLVGKAAQPSHGAATRTQNLPHANFEGA